MSDPLGVEARRYVVLEPMIHIELQEARRVRNADAGTVREV